MSKIGVDGGEVKDENGRCCRAPIRVHADEYGWCRGEVPPPMVVAQYSIEESFVADVGWRSRIYPGHRRLATLMQYCLCDPRC